MVGSSAGTQDGAYIVIRDEFTENYNPSRNSPDYHGQSALPKVLLEESYYDHEEDGEFEYYDEEEEYEYQSQVLQQDSLN